MTSEQILHIKVQHCPSLTQHRLYTTTLIADSDPKFEYLYFMLIAVICYCPMMWCGIWCSVYWDLLCKKKKKNSRAPSIKDQPISIVYIICIDTFLLQRTFYKTHLTRPSVTLKFSGPFWCYCRFLIDFWFVNIS